uniref:NB-ARC domain-containing protein n=1 Tax=Aegilops tauschii subsp. strangulata TaxID=200361 RepID=A0A452ZYJ8_AEGTS
NSLLGKLTALLSDEYNLLKRVRKEIQFLKCELDRIQAFLHILADMEKFDDLTKKRRDSLRDLSYEMEDCIDRFMDRLGNRDAKRGFIKRTMRRLRTMWTRHDIANLVKDLKARVMEESERNERYKLDESYYSATRTVEIDPRMTAIHEEVKGLVAMDGPMKHVIALLMDESKELKVVPIVGSGGLGKTTLAMEVYRKLGSGGDFQCQACVSVSRTLDLVKLLKDILSQINKDAYKECQSWEKEQLIREIKHILTGKRYFIVIDDVWKEQDWKLVKTAFPENNNGSRIIATTRITGVANLCCSVSDEQTYQMAPLDDVDSRRLFFKRIFSSVDSCPSELEEVSARILKKCGGLPLAIITFACLLASKTHNKDEWERLQDSIGTGSSFDKDGNLKGMKDILLHSYLDLPHHLKTCLLYLCLYPEDSMIDIKLLKWKWIAEGFIATQWGSLDQVAQNCFNELVNRNMIQPVYGNYDSSVRYCRVHDMVLDLIISLSDEENFATVLNGRICNFFPNKIRRLSMQSSGKEHKGAVGAITETKIHIRSLTVFESDKPIVPHFVDFHALRVLDLFGCDSLENKHVKHIGSSRQLRYLRISSYKITELPSGIGKLQHLETLDLRECYSLHRLPSTVAQLQKLVRLFVSGYTQLPAGGFRSLQALEELRFEETDDPVRFAEELNELGKCNLRTGGETAKRLFCNPCSTYPCLQVLKIQSAIGMVPRGMASLENLMKLCIKVTEFDKEDLQVLMGMPSLAHLELEITREAINGKLIIGSDGFKLLKVFHFRYSLFRHPVEVKPTGGLRLTFAPGAMPALRCLCLHLNPMFVASDFCEDLGVEHLPGLAQLEVEITCFKAVPRRVKALECSIEKATSLLPKCRIRVSRAFEGHMFKDDKEWEEVVAKVSRAKKGDQKNERVITKN